MGNIARTSPSLKYIHSNIQKQFKYYMIENTQIVVYVPLGNSWDEFIASLGKRTRRDVKYDRRYLQKKFDVKLKIYDKYKDKEKAFNDLEAVFKKRWRKGKAKKRYNNENSFLFEKEVSFSYFEKGICRIFVLYLNDQPVAVFSGFIQNNKLFGDVFAHDNEYRKYSVGNVLLGNVIEYCINEGLGKLDLSRGNESYKYKWKGVESDRKSVV